MQPQNPSRRAESRVGTTRKAKVLIHPATEVDGLTLLPDGSICAWDEEEQVVIQDPDGRVRIAYIWDEDETVEWMARIEADEEEAEFGILDVESASERRRLIATAGLIEWAEMTV